MNVLINGTPRNLPEAVTVAGLLRTLELGAARVAVEINGAVVPRRDHDRTVLRDGDWVEVVQFVGGG